MYTDRKIIVTDNLYLTKHIVNDFFTEIEVLERKDITNLLITQRKLNKIAP